MRHPEGTGPRQRLAVVPGHPLRRVLLQLLGMPLQLGEVVERIDAVQLAGVDQAHEQVAHARSIARSCRTDEFLRCRMAFFRARSTRLLSSGAPGLRRNSVSFSQCLSR